MFKSILVPAVGLAKDVGALKLAFNVARLFDGHLDCLHVRPDPADLVLSASGFGVPALGTQMIVTDLIEVLQETDAKRSERSRKAYEAFCKRESLWSEGAPHKAHGPSASWWEKVGHESDILQAQARVHDLTVLGDVSRSIDPSADTVVDVLMGSGRPVLLSSARTPETFKTILIAWKDKPESAAAVSAAMPLIAQAERVIILQVAEDSDETAESARHLADNLRWHGADVEVIFEKKTGASVFDTIMTTADVVKADMLVMGAYGHSRLGEFIFGGMTNHVLDGTRLPVFMVH